MNLNSVFYVIIIKKFNNSCFSSTFIAWILLDPLINDDCVGFNFFIKSASQIDSLLYSLELNDGVTSGSFQTCSCDLKHASPLLKAFSRLPISHTSANIITPYVKRNRKILEEKSWLNPSQRNLSVACWVSLEEQKIHKDQTKHKHSYNDHFKHYYSYWGADTMLGSQCGFTVTVYFLPSLQRTVAIKAIPCDTYYTCFPLFYTSFTCGDPHTCQEDENIF